MPFVDTRFHPFHIEAACVQLTWVAWYILCVAMQYATWQIRLIATVVGFLPPVVLGGSAAGLAFGGAVLFNQFEGNRLKNEVIMLLGRVMMLIGAAGITAVLVGPAYYRKYIC